MVRNGPGMRGSGGPGKDKAEKLARRRGYPGRGGANLIWELRGDKLRAGRRARPIVCVSHRRPC